ncbi:VCBS repeat-containing protein [Filimonas lacunae]|uniref:VCBS repeat-containing protein n=1 Tax=Filimonas lacunae TaxID=477680 RepID=A0A173MK77_9BACT|nr:DUF4302 domain-containing protein [Filimonas lacunae]BAV07877.1 hypothetical protein FLA_3908 [Filimonas lacunae]SIT05911.1 VCBS repeat-containing protein [Filimonas lacunae]
MKKLINIYTLFLLTVAIASGCKKSKDDNINGIPTDQRLSAALAKYKAKLLSGTDGWVLQVTPAGLKDQFGLSISPFSYYVLFTDSSACTQLADWDTTSVKTPQQSTYSIRLYQRPTLSFDNYSYVAKASDPGDANGPVYASEGGGYAWGSDFEFAFADNIDADKLGDTINLKGIFNKSPAVLIKATKAQHDSAFAGAWARSKSNFASINKILTYWKRLTVNGITYEVILDEAGRTFTFKWFDDTLHTQAIPYLYNLDGSASLVQAFTNGSTTITGFNNVSYDGTNANVTIGGINQATAITPATSAIKLDSAAPKAWYNQMNINFNGKWASDKAYHATGIDDSCKITAIASYQAYWYAGAGVFGTGSEGTCVLANNALVGTYSFSTTTFPANTGRIRFMRKSISGTNAAIVAGATMLYGGTTNNSSFREWYLVPIDVEKNIYDMVRYPDAKAWIRWHP